MSTLQHELGKRDPFESASQRAFLNLQRTAADLDGAFAALFRARGLTGSSYNALRILRGEGPCSCQTIGERLVVRVPDVTRLVDRLVKLGLAERTRSAEDRRVVLVAITGKGRAILADLDEPVTELHAGQFAELTERELETLSALLERARRAPEGATP